MSKQVFSLLCGFMFATAGVLLAGGCFTSPTSPSVLTAGGNAQGTPGNGSGTGSGGDTGGAVTPTPTPTTGGGTGSGTIQGTVSNAAAGTTMIYASSGLVIRQATISGNGPFTITNLPDGTYTVQAMDSAYGFSATVPATITGGNTVSGVNLVIQ